MLPILSLSSTRSSVSEAPDIGMGSVKRDRPVRGGRPGPYNSRRKLGSRRPRFASVSSSELCWCCPLVGRHAASAPRLASR
eukprot:1742173-Prymnesium_polylepis.2